MAANFNPFFNERRPLTKEMHARSLKNASKIRVWKFMLPISAVGIVIGLGFWPYIKDRYQSLAVHAQKRSMPAIKMTNQLVNPRFYMVDSKGRPIVLGAASATQTSIEQADMVNPHSKINMDNGGQITITADKGHFNQQDQRLQYNNHVELQSQDGFKLQTSSADINIKTNEAEGTSTVYGTGPSGSLQGEGFKLSDKKVQLIGKSQMSINN